MLSSCASTSKAKATTRATPPCASTNAVVAKPVVRNRLCATAITLRAKTGIDHWTITVRGGTLRVDVTDNDVKLTGSATIVGKIELL